MPSWAVPWIWREFRDLAEIYPGETFRLVAGGADGADTLAELVGQYMGWEVVVERADWKNLGRAAGPERNQRQLSKWKPLRAFFFHHSPLLGTGTLDMYTRCVRAGVVSKVVLYPTIMIVKVLNLDSVPDSQGETFDPAGVIVPTLEVPIKYRFGEGIDDVMGWATLERREDGIYAHLKVLGERLHLAKNMYPSIGGVVLGKKDKLITACEIRMVGLSPDQNCDRRIQKCGEQKVEE